MTLKKTKSANQIAHRPVGAVMLGYEGENAATVGEQLALLLTAQFNTQFKAPFLVSGEPGNDMGINPTKYNFVPLEILYHRLEVTLPSTFNFLSGSGIYRYGGDPNHIVNIQEFVDAYFDGDLSQAPNLEYDVPLYNNASGAPNILVRKQCYVVVELSGAAGLSVRANHAAIDVGDSNSRDDYCSLVHYDDLGNTYSGTTGSAPCRLFSFAVENPDRDDRQQDQFNLYLQVISPSAVTYATIDPFIKNRGGKPGLFNKKKKRK